MPDISAAYANNALAGGLTAGNTYYMSLHSADPGTTGANEIAGTTRQPVTFNAPSGGSQTMATTQGSFTSMPSVAGNVWVGLWTAVTAGTFLIGDPTAAVTGPVASGATVDITGFTVSAS